MKRQLDPDATLTAIVGIVGAVMLFVVILLLQALFYGAERSEARRKVVDVGFEDLVRARTEQQELLNSYRWIDQTDGVVGIPIERAMELLVARSGGDRATAAESRAKQGAR